MEEMIVKKNNLEQKPDFGIEITKLVELIDKEKNEIKNIGDKTNTNYNFRESIHKLISDANDTFNNGQPKFMFYKKDKRKKMYEQVIGPFFTLLKEMSGKCVDCESDCFPVNADALSQLTDIVKWGKDYFSDENVLQDIEQQCFDIMKNIMINKKKLLLEAIKAHKIEDGFLKTNLQPTLVNVLTASNYFSRICKTEQAYKFLRSFYEDIFDELIKLLNQSYEQKDHAMPKKTIDAKDNELTDQTIGFQYETQLMGVFFKAVAENIHETNPHAAYIIGNLFIDKYYNNNEKQKYLYTPYLMSFIQNEFNDEVQTSDPDYFQKKLKLISDRIDILKSDTVKKIDSQNIAQKKCYFGFAPDEFFGVKEGVATDKTDQTAEKFRLNMDYVAQLEKALSFAWSSCDILFHDYRKKYMDDRNSKEKREKYERIKKDRQDIYDMYRDLETEKQKLLKERLTSLIGEHFNKLSKTEKILRSSFLILTFLIYAPIFICIKTLKKFFHRLRLGFEAILKLYAGFRGYRTCKDVRAEDCELNLDGLKINENQEINTRIKWYETKTCLLIRRILFPIDLVIHIIIGIFAAIKKIFTSIIKVFTVVKQIYQDIWDDNACSHIFKTEGVDENKSEVICNEKRNISVLPTGNIKVRDKFIDMTCPRVPCYDFSKKPKSIWDHIQCATGFKSIKNANEYDRYAHEHSGTPRLKYD